MEWLILNAADSVVHDCAHSPDPFGSSLLGSFPNLASMPCSILCCLMLAFYASKHHTITIRVRIWKKSTLHCSPSSSADDLINPPERGILEHQIKRVTHGRAIVMPTNDKTRGHGSHTIAALWK